MGLFVCFDVVVDDTIDNEKVVSNTSTPPSSNVRITHKLVDNFILVIENHLHKEASILMDEKNASVIFYVFKISFSRLRIKGNVHKFHHVWYFMMFFRIV